MIVLAWIYKLFHWRKVKRYLANYDHWLYPLGQTFGMTYGRSFKNKLEYLIFYKITQIHNKKK